MRARTGVTRDGVDHGDALSDGARRRRLWLVRRGVDLLHGRAADRDLRGAARTGSTARASSRTSRPAAPSAATARRSRGSRWRSSSTRSPHDLGLDPAEMRLAQSPAGGIADGELPAHRIDGPRTCIEKVVSGVRLAGAPREARRRARARARVLAPTSAARAFRSTGTRMPQSRRAAQARPQRRRDRRSAARRTSGRGSDSILAYDRRRGARRRPVRHPRRHGRHGPDARRPRLLFVARHAHDGQRRAPGGRARARDPRRGRRGEARRARRADRLRGRPGLRRGGSPENGVTFAEAVVLAESRYGTIGTVGSYTPPRSRGPISRRGRRSLARLLLLGRGRRGRRRSRDGHLHGRRRSGSRTTSASASTRCSSSARSRAPSTWASARR